MCSLKGHFVLISSSPSTSCVYTNIKCSIFLATNIIFCHILGLHVTFRQDSCFEATAHLIVANLTHITLSHSILISKPLALRYNLARTDILHDCCFLGFGKSGNIRNLSLLSRIETVVLLLRSHMLLTMKGYRRVGGRYLECWHGLFVERLNGLLAIIDSVN